MKRSSLYEKPFLIHAGDLGIAVDQIGHGAAGGHARQALAADRLDVRAGKLVLGWAIVAGLKEYRSASAARM